LPQPEKPLPFSYLFDFFAHIPSFAEELNSIPTEKFDSSLMLPYKMHMRSNFMAVSAGINEVDQAINRILAGASADRVESSTLDFKEDGHLDLPRFPALTG
jgi:hypothetical protein